MTISDLNQEARDLVDADTTSYSAATLLRRINQAYETVVGWIINADGDWQWDDTNYTDFPIGTYTLVNGQPKYSFNDKFLQLEEVQIMNNDGKYQIIRPIDQKDSFSPIPLSEEFATSGLPLFYDKISDDTIKLFPAPDNGVSVTLASGLKIRFKRTADIYTSAEVTTGIKEPGFASPFHIILSYMAARPYAMSYKKDRVAMLNDFVGDTTPIPSGMKKEILDHYAKRSKDERNVIEGRKIQHI